MHDSGQQSQVEDLWLESQIQNDSSGQNQNVGHCPGQPAWWAVHWEGWDTFQAQMGL